MRINSMSRLLVPVSTFALLAVFLSLVSPAIAGPQHYGCGVSYLAAIEDVGGTKRLAVYEGPARAKNSSWISRWLDTSTDYSTVVAGGVVIGNFWPASFSKEYLVTVNSGTNLTANVYEAPEVFETGGWTVKSTAGNLHTSACLGATAGDLLSLGKDQLILCQQSGSNLQLIVLTPPSTKSGTTWTTSKTATLPVPAGAVGTYLGVACGDFWNENKDCIALATLVGGATKLTYYTYNGSGFTYIATDAAADIPVIQTNGLAAADYVVDGYDVLTLIPASGGFQVRTVPTKSGWTYSDGTLYTGKAISGQWLPGNGGTSSKLIMTGTFGNTATSRLAFGAGRVFGYINTDLNSQLSYSAAVDAEISFMHRTPIKSESTYGWPAYNANTTYEINLKNNGTPTINSNLVRLKIWYNTPYRNADTNPLTSGSPNYSQLVDVSLPAFDPNNPAYAKKSVTFPWPYQLEAAGPGATWQRPNLSTVGERWVIAVIEYASDSNVRNNRYEAALVSPTFHPVLRNNASLADRNPTVQGDPCSKEYLCRKLADAINLMWERSTNKNGDDILQRPYFDSYELGWMDDLPEPARTAKWNLVTSQYEGWRELDGWWGLGQSWETYDWRYAGEWHETGHLFHPCGDLYQYYAHPVWTGGAKMADGTPVQMETHCWGPDSFGEGQSMIGPPACEIMKTCLVGARNAGIEQWWTLQPAKFYIRVLDRDGNPVQGAEVKLWKYGTGAAAGTGTTGADGKWDTGRPHGTATVDAFGRKHYNGEDVLTNMASIITVKIGNYQDSSIIGTADVGAHGQYEMMWHSWTDPTGWTFDVKTNYKSTSADPTFTVDGAVQGKTVKIGITGASGATYRLYRKWEPAYIRTVIGDYTAAGVTCTITQQLDSADSRQSGRQRAIYEVTQVVGASESLPKTIQVFGLNSGCGIATQSDGKLIVAANVGYANPIAELFNGVTPYQEYFYHYRFGHTPYKVAPSRLTAGQYYMTLSFADMNPEYRFDLVPPLTGGSSGYDVRNDFGNMSASACSSSAPWTMTVDSATAAKINAGDQISSGVGTGYVTSVSGNTITTDAQVVNSGNLSFGYTRLAGKPGSVSANRELSNARGLGVIVYNNAEYIVIADTGNRKAVVWNDKTKYIAAYPFNDSSARPAAVAQHPTIANKFFVLDRRTSGTSYLYLLTFAGSTPTVDPGYPITVAASDYSGWTEMGLAAATDPSNGNVVVAVTNATTKRVIELTNNGGVWTNTGAYTQAIGTYAGTAALVSPTDVSYVVNGNELKLYAIDGANRVVLLTQRSATMVDPSGAKSMADGAWVVSTGVTTAVFTDTRSFYVESESRSSGIQVRYALSDSPPALRRETWVSGNLFTDPDTRERYIQCVSWQQAEGDTDLGPLAMTTKSIGGAAFGLQEAVSDGVGLSNTGLLVKVCGNVTAAPGDRIYIYVSDGSGLSDGSGSDGVRLDLGAVPQPQRPAPAIGDNVTATGISSRYQFPLSTGDYYRAVKLRAVSDFGYTMPPVEVAWSVISGPANESFGAYNHIGTDGTSVFAVFQNGQFWKYSFTAGDPTHGSWTRLADPPRTVNAGSSYSDLAYQNGYMYTSARPLPQYDPNGYNRTIIRYNISADTWQVWTSGGADNTSSQSSGNALFMDPVRDGVGYSAWHAGSVGWVTFDWNAGTASNAWMNYGTVTRNEDVAIDGGGNYYATQNDWAMGKSSGDVVYTWSGLSGMAPSNLVQKPWQAGFGQSVEFIPSAIAPSRHNELWVIRGSDGSSSSFEGWGNASADWARYDLTDGQWAQVGVLPGTVGYNGEVVLASGSVFVRGTAANWYVAKLH